MNGFLSFAYATALSSGNPKMFIKKNKLKLQNTLPVVWNLCMRSLIPLSSNVFTSGTDILLLCLKDFLKQCKQYNLKNLQFKSQLYYVKEDKRITS